jgi:hypothetical protein
MLFQSFVPIINVLPPIKNVLPIDLALLETPERSPDERHLTPAVFGATMERDFHHSRFGRGATP